MAVPSSFGFRLQPVIKNDNVIVKSDFQLLHKLCLVNASMQTPCNVNGNIRRTVGLLRGGCIANSIDWLQGWYFNTLK